MRYNVRLNPGDEVETRFPGVTANIRARGIVTDNSQAELNDHYMISWFTTDGSKLKSLMPSRELTKVIRVGPDPVQFDLAVSDAELAEVRRSLLGEGQSEHSAPHHPPRFPEGGTP